MFYWSLCLELGYRAPRELLQGLTSKEITQWRAFLRARDMNREARKGKSPTPGGTSGDNTGTGRSIAEKDAERLRRYREQRLND